MAIWLTSDTHLDHDFVASLRGFDSTREHDAHVVREWNKRVRHGDTVWVLGDFGMGTPERWIDTALKLNGTLHLVTGNHDNCAAGFKQPNREKLDEWLTVFASIQQYGKLNYKGETYLLSHYPYGGDHAEEDRHAQWRLRDLGSPLLHGHTHSTERISHSTVGTLQIHVGWDAWGKPVPLSTIHALAEASK